MQIPGLVQPISLQLSGGAANTQQTSLLVSVPVTSTVNTIGGVQSGNSGVSSAQTVVFTNSNAQTYAISNLPIGKFNKKIQIIVSFFRFRLIFVVSYLALIIILIM